MNFISGLFSLVKKEERSAVKDGAIDSVVINSENILDFFAEYFHLEKELIIAHNRKKEIVEVRDAIVYILRKYGGLSFPAISKILGGRDHTTIIHSYNKKKEINIDDSLKDIILKIIEFRDLEKKEKDLLAQGLISTITKDKNVNGYRLIKPKEIQNRNLDILNLFRYGFTLVEIGKRYSLTRERARQIIKDTIHRLDFNKSIIDHRNVKNIDELYEEEKHKISLKKLGTSPKILKVKKEKKEKKWGMYTYDYCKICNTTDFPHSKNGACEKCSGAFRGERREKIVLSHGSKCDNCGISREEAKKEHGRDFYISKNMEVFCRKCHLVKTGRILSASKKNKWKMFYKNN